MKKKVGVLVVLTLLGVTAPGVVLPVLAATSIKNPSNYSDPYSGWSDEDDAYEEGDDYAYCQADATENGTIIYYGFGHSLPPEAYSITVECYIKHREQWPNPPTIDPEIYLYFSWNGGSSWSGAHSVPLYKSSSTWTNIWTTCTGHTWSYNECNGNNLRVKFEFNAAVDSCFMNIDWVQTRVTYT
jgi:hypothetical protein